MKPKQTTITLKIYFEIVSRFNCLIYAFISSVLRLEQYSYNCTSNPCYVEEILLDDHSVAKC